MPNSGHCLRAYLRTIRHVNSFRMALGSAIKIGVSELLSSLPAGYDWPS
jgi:hypothetical protein